MSALNLHDPAPIGAGQWPGVQPLPPATFQSRIEARALILRERRWIPIRGRLLLDRVVSFCRRHAVGIAHG